jgi:Ni/Co efflux regulator RcnB
MDTLAAHYIADGFEQGRVKGELNGWKKKAQRMSNEYSVLHRDWHDRTLMGIAWRRVAEDLYRRHYKKLDKEATLKMFRTKLAEAKDYYEYDPNQRPGT